MTAAAPTNGSEKSTMSFNLFSFLNLLTTEPNGIQMTRSPPSDPRIWRRDSRRRADGLWQKDQGTLQPFCASPWEPRVYYGSCRRAGWRNHSDSRRHDKANAESLRARAAKEQPRGSQARNPGTMENHKKDNGSHEAFQASRPSLAFQEQDCP